MIRKIYYNRTNTCDRCREENRITDKSMLYPGNARKEIDEKDNWTGRQLCLRCYGKDYYRKTMSFITNSRSGNLIPNCNKAKGDLAEELTDRWKGVKSLNKELDCYNTPIDHSPDPITGQIYQTKSKRYDPINKFWMTNFKSEHNAIRRGYKFDKLIFYCISENGKYIERIYEIPEEEIIKRTSVAIVNNPTKRRYVEQWYEKYRLKDEEELKKVNEIWKKIILE